MASSKFYKSDTTAFSDMPLEETLEWVQIISCHLANEIDFLKQFDHEHADSVNKLLSDETIIRFKGIAYSLRFPYQNYMKLPDSETKQQIEQGLLVQSWSSLGSLLESTLQIFLAFYYRFYVQSEWYKWDEEAIHQISRVLNGTMKEELNSIVKENEVSGMKGLTNDIKKSFLGKVKDILKLKTDLPKIDKITLSDLIDFYFSQRVIVSSEYGKADLQKIRDYRNAIHSFQKRSFGSWDEFNKYLKDLILLSIDMLNRLPPIPDGVPIPEWYYEDRSAIAMQEKKWFDYRMSLELD